MVQKPKNLIDKGIFNGIKLLDSGVTSVVIGVVLFSIGKLSIFDFPFIHSYTHPIETSLAKQCEESAKRTAIY